MQKVSKAPFAHSWRQTAVALAAKILWCALHSALLEEKKVHLLPLSMLSFLQILNPKSFPGRGWWSHGGLQRWRRSCVHRRGDVAPRLCPGDGSPGLGPCCFAGKRAVPQLWLLRHSCVQALQNAKTKNATCSKRPFEFSRWSGRYRSARKPFICMLGAFCVHIGVHFKRQKKQRDAPIYSYFSGMGTTGKINKRKVRGNENPGKYYNKWFTHLYLDCLCNYSLKNPPGHIYKWRQWSYSTEILYHIKRTFSVFSWEFVFLKEILIKCIANIRVVSACTFPVSMEQFQCC